MSEDDKMDEQEPSLSSRVRSMIRHGDDLVGTWRVGSSDDFSGRVFKIGRHRHRDVLMLEIPRYLGQDPVVDTRWVRKHSVPATRPQVVLALYDKGDDRLVVEDLEYGSHRVLYDGVFVCSFSTGSSEWADHVFSEAIKTISTHITSVNHGGLATDRPKMNAIRNLVRSMSPEQAELFLKVIDDAASTKPALCLVDIREPHLEALTTVSDVDELKARIAELGMALVYIDNEKAESAL